MSLHDGNLPCCSSDGSWTQPWGSGGQPGQQSEGFPSASPAPEPSSPHATTSPERSPLTCGSHLQHSESEPGRGEGITSQHHDPQTHRTTTAGAAGSDRALYHSRSGNGRFKFRQQQSCRCRILRHLHSVRLKLLLKRFHLHNNL